MTDTEQWALNREIAQTIEPRTDLPERTGYDPEGGNFSPKKMWYYVQFLGWRELDFAGDLNAAWEMEERLDDVGLWPEYEPALLHRSHHYEPEIKMRTRRRWHLPALVRARAAAEVLRERGAK